LRASTRSFATSLCAAVVELSQRLYERQFAQLPELLKKHTEFYALGPATYEDA
jgi:hypothetical protein